MCVKNNELSKVFFLISIENLNPKHYIKCQERVPETLFFMTLKLL